MDGLIFNNISAMVGIQYNLQMFNTTRSRKFSIAGDIVPEILLFPVIQNAIVIAGQIRIRVDI